MKNTNLRRLTRLSVCVALLCVSAYLALPVGAIPITCQTLILFLSALLLPPVQALTCAVLYLLLGICGLPVFAGGTAGFGILLSPSGGFLLAFPLAAFLISLFKGKTFPFWRGLAITLGVGIPVLYLSGLALLIITQGLPLAKGLQAVVLPFLPVDLIKGIGAVYLAKKLQKTPLQ